MPKTVAHQRFPANKAPRPKGRGINSALEPNCLRPKGRGIEPEEIQLLAKPSDGLLPITIHYVNDGLQVFAAKEWDPDWHIRFMGAVIKPNYPTRLAELQTS